MKKIIYKSKNVFFIYYKDAQLTCACLIMKNVLEIVILLSTLLKKNQKKKEITKNIGFYW